MNPSLTKETLMFKFAFGLTSGIALGVTGTIFAAGVFAAMIEDLPEVRTMIKEIAHDLKS